MNPTDRDFKTKAEFIEYIKEHPQERFWQSVRNFSNFDFIYGSNAADHQLNEEWAEVKDTFYIEGK